MMNDTPKILADLKSKAMDASQAERLSQLYNEIIERFETAASPGVTSLLEEKLGRLREKFDQSYRTLRYKMGEAPDQGEK
jgi:hypothetical protein